MMINEEEFNSNESVRNYYKSNLSNEYKKLKAIILLNKNIKAPIEINQTVGFLNIKLKDYLSINFNL